jgi:2-dehydro-3-deoxygalactonokinase
MNLLAVDWGTTSLRLALLDAAGSPLAEISTAQGIMAVPEGEFATVFRAARGQLMRDFGLNDSQIEHALTLICGMAGSANGWLLAPYCPCPAGFEDVAERLSWVERGSIAIVPGLSCQHAHAPDVMRGEETQILGAMQLTGCQSGWFVLPGTHSKWAWVEGGRVRHFMTSMTGELYAALSQHTILAKTIATDAPWEEDAFVRGVRLAQQEPAQFLHRIFAVRTHGLFGQQTPAQAASLLSGLCIGEEIRAQMQLLAQPLTSGNSPAMKDAAGPTASTLPDGIEADAITLIGSPALTQRYTVALQTCGLRARALGAECTWAGLHALARQLPPA